MEGFISALTAAEGGLTAASIWGAITPISTVVITLTLIKLGYRMVKGSIETATNPRSKKVMK